MIWKSPQSICQESVQVTVLYMSRSIWSHQQQLNALHPNSTEQKKKGVSGKKRFILGCTDAMDPPHLLFQGISVPEVKLVWFVVELGHQEDHI